MIYYLFRGVGGVVITSRISLSECLLGGGLCSLRSFQVLLLLQMRKWVAACKLSNLFLAVSSIRYSLNKN